MSIFPFRADALSASESMSHIFIGETAVSAGDETARFPPLKSMLNLISPITKFFAILITLKVPGGAEKGFQIQIFRFQN